MTIQTNNKKILPEKAAFRIIGWPIDIRNHEVTGVTPLFQTVMRIIHDPESNAQTLLEFQKQGIGFKAVIEYCVNEFKNNEAILERIIYWHYAKIKFRRAEINRFLKKEVVETFSEQFIKKMQSCENWIDLYGELNMASKFSQDFVSQIDVALKEQWFKTLNPKD